MASLRSVCAKKTGTRREGKGRILAAGGGEEPRLGRETMGCWVAAAPG